MIEFQELLRKLRGPDWARLPTRLLVIDPGETTGIAIFDRGQIESVKQLTGAGPAMIQELNEFFRLWPTHVVVEDYKVYAHKTKEHTWSSLFTPKLIGAIEALCTLQGLQPVMQMASCKRFVTNDKLRAWNMYVTGPHARDAIRHGCYFLLFNKDI
ncbi:MAG: hypothetical protein DDT19_00697 [Syntrophomonadaceae bacterium]|nr:hypothetical protein [Bacillota bacterium]